MAALKVGSLDRSGHVELWSITRRHDCKPFDNCQIALGFWYRTYRDLRGSALLTAASGQELPFDVEKNVVNAVKPAHQSNYNTCGRSDLVPMNVER